jgi:hypothetical protein
VEPVKPQALCYLAVRSLNSRKPSRQQTHQGYICSLTLAFWLCAMIHPACANLGIGSSVGRNFLSRGGRPVFLLCKGPVRESQWDTALTLLSLLSLLPCERVIKCGQEPIPDQSVHAGERNYIIRSGRLLNSAKCCPGQKLAGCTELKCSGYSVPCQKQSLIDTARGH